METTSFYIGVYFYRSCAGCLSRCDPESCGSKHKIPTIESMPILVSYNSVNPLVNFKITEKDNPDVRTCWCGFEEANQDDRIKMTVFLTLNLTENYNCRRYYEFEYDRKWLLRTVSIYWPLLVLLTCLQYYLQYCLLWNQGQYTTFSLFQLTRRDIMSSKCTTSFFGLLVFCIFGLLVKKIWSSGFYLFGRPD